MGDSLIGVCAFRSSTTTYDTSNEPGTLFADCMSRILTYGATNFDINEDIPCFIAEPKDPNDSLGDTEPVSVETRGNERIFQMKLSEDIMPYAITHNELVRDQNSGLFSHKVCLALEKGGDLDQKKRKVIFFENKESIICRKAYTDSATQYVAPASLIDRLLCISHYPKTASHPGVRRFFFTLRQELY